MSESIDLERWHLTPEQVRRVERTCDAYETALRKTGPADTLPRIENYLEDASDAERPVLLVNLLELELTYRRQRGEALAAVQYVERFPQYPSLVEQCWSKLLPSCDALDTAGTASSLDSVAGSEQSGHHLPAIPGYEVLGELAHGGMGIVY